MVGKLWEDKCEYENFTYFGWDPLTEQAMNLKYLETFALYTSKNVVVGLSQSEISEL